MSPEEANPWTVMRLLEWTKDYFTRQGMDSPRVAAEVLLAHVLGCQRIELYARFNDQPPQPQRSAFRELVKRAAAHEPVAYLVGAKEFYSMKFQVGPEVLIPRPETELVVEKAVAHLRELDGPTVAWDACTGSGCVAAAVAAACPEARVLATDISPEALAVAERNIAENGLSDRVTCARADLLELPEGATDMAPFDVITANPPYVAQDDPVGDSVRFEPEIALYSGPTGMECIRPIIEAAPDRLKSGGVLVMEFGYRHADEVRGLLAEREGFDEAEIFRDPAGIERVVVARTC